MSPETGWLLPPGFPVGEKVLGRDLKVMRGRAVCREQGRDRAGAKRGKT